VATILERLLAELGAETRIVATGGQASLIVEGSKYINTADPDLTLKGLLLTWQKNQ
jgi:type III pantothenate kinase